MTIDSGLRNPMDESAAGNVRRLLEDRGVGGDDLPALDGYLGGLVRARVTGTVSPDVPLVSLGFDSLAAVELWARLRTDLGLDIPATDLLGLTLVALAARIREQAGSGAAPAGGGPVVGGPAEEGDDDVSAESAAQLLAALEGLDEAELDRLAAGLGLETDSADGEAGN